MSAQNALLLIELTLLAVMLLFGWWVGVAIITFAILLNLSQRW